MLYTAGDSFFFFLLVPQAIAIDLLSLNTMKNSFVFIFLALSIASIPSSYAQELDEFAEEDAAFMAWGRFYKSISPIINAQHTWKDWETEYDSAQKFQRAQKVRGLLNLIFEEGVDHKGEIYGDTLDIYPSNLHYLDYNNDGFEDLIIQQSMRYRGHAIKMYSGSKDSLVLEKELRGMIVAMSKDETNGGLNFTVYDYPCCDGYVHSLNFFSPVIVDNLIVPQLIRSDKYIESNLKSFKNLPENFDSEKTFRVKSKAVVWYKGTRPIYQKFEPEEGFQRKYRNFHPFALLSENVMGVVLNEAIAEKKTGTDTMVFVRFVGVLDASNSIRHLARRPLVKPSTLYIVNYYGWIDKKDLLIED